MKIKEFIIKYKLYIIVGIIVITLIGVLIFIFSKGKSPTVEPPVQNKNIISPFVKDLSLVNYSIPDNKNFFTENTVSVYNILPYKDEIPALVYKFDSNIQRKYSSDSIESWISSNKTIVYYTSTGIFSIFTKDGIRQSLTIGNKEDLLGFLKTYFDYTNIKPESIVVSENTNGGYIYKGKYTMGENEFGSMNLDSYAFVVKTSANKSITELSILLYNPNSLSLYSEYSPMTEEELLKDQRVYIKRISIGESYENLNRYVKGSLSLSRLDIRNMTKGYIFSNFTHGYVYPAYILSADARYTDSKKGTHVADVLMFFMAINPKYVSNQENVIEFFEYGTGNR